MPYIKQEARPKLDGAIDELIAAVETDGELNYTVTRLVQGAAEKRGGGYAVFNALVGVLECAKLEFYRRVVRPYEDRKARENGDVL
jgi:hypothetical protein